MKFQERGGHHPLNRARFSPTSCQLKFEHRQPEPRSGRLHLQKSNSKLGHGSEKESSGFSKKLAAMGCSSSSGKSSARATQKLTKLEKAVRHPSKANVQDPVRMPQNWGAGCPQCLKEGRPHPQVPCPWGATGQNKEMKKCPASLFLLILPAKAWNFPFSFPLHAPSFH